MLGPLAFLCALLFPGGHAEIRLEQPAVVVARESGSASLLCTAKTKVNYIHWYRHQEGKAPQRLLRLAMYQSDVWWDTVEKADKVTATEAKDGYSCTLSVLKLEKSDEGVYYCAAWETHSHSCSPGPSAKRSLTLGAPGLALSTASGSLGVALGSALSTQDSC